MWIVVIVVLFSGQDWAAREQIRKLRREDRTNAIGARDRINERMEQMAVAVDLEFEGGTVEQYDEVAKLM
jgi:hypothetical protein